MSGRSRWYHGEDQPDPPSPSSRFPATVSLYGDDDPIAPKQLFSALVSPSFHLSNATLTHFRHSGRHLHPSFISLPVMPEREGAENDLSASSDSVGGMVSFPPGQYWLVAWAMVDQQYGDVGQGEPRHLPPQSHVSNVRTNSSWCPPFIIHTYIHTYIHTMMITAVLLKALLIRLYIHSI